MDPWPEIVFLAADGEHTVEEYVREMMMQYEGTPPPGVREQIHRTLNDLVNEGILRLHEEPEPLPPEYAEDGELFQRPQ